MADPIKFPQANTNFKKPEGWTDEQCNSLPAYMGELQDQDSGTKYPTILSQWQFSPEELEELNRNGGKCWLNLVSPVMVPASVFVGDPFTEPVNTVVEVLGEGCLIKSIKADYYKGEGLTGQDQEPNTPDYYRGGSFTITPHSKRARRYLTELLEKDEKIILPYLTLNTKGETVDKGTFLHCQIRGYLLAGGTIEISYMTLESDNDKN